MPFISKRQKYTQTSDNLVAAFYCASQKTPSTCGAVTALLGQNSTRHSGGGEQVFALLAPLRFEVLNPSHQPEIKHRTVGLGMPKAWA